MVSKISSAIHCSSGWNKVRFRVKNRPLSFDFLISEDCPNFFLDHEIFARLKWPRGGFGQPSRKLKPSGIPPGNQSSIISCGLLLMSSVNILSSLSELINIDPLFWNKSSPQHSGLTQGYCVDWKTLSCGKSLSDVSSHQMKEIVILFSLPCGRFILSEQRARRAQRDPSDLFLTHERIIPQRVLINSSISRLRTTESQTY
jgi:hypothetical protein